MFILIYNDLHNDLQPACFGSEPAVYEYYVKKIFLNYQLKCCDEIIFIFGSSTPPGSDCWSKKRANELEAQIEFFGRVRNGELPHSQCRIGNDGHRNYDNLKVTPPWLVHQIMEIVEKEPRVKVYQSECDKDCAIVELAVQLGCPVMSNDSDFLLFAAQPVLKMNHNWRGAGEIIENNWHTAPEINLEHFYLPLLSLLCFNRECEILEVELEPFWYALIGSAEFESSRKPNVIPHVVSFLKAVFSRKEDLISIEYICDALDDVALKSDQLKNHNGPYFGDSHDSRRTRLIRSLRRFMVTGKSYPWEDDDCFKTENNPLNPAIGGHPLLRGAEETEVFQALQGKIANELMTNRSRLLSSALPAPFFTESIFQLYNSCNPCLDANAGNLLLSYLRRELVIFGIEDAKYARYERKGSRISCYERDQSFAFLNGEEIPTLDVLYKSDKELKVRSFLACFDAELLMYIDADFHELPCFWSTFLACLRYLWVHARLKEWEVNALVMQFALTGLFTAPDKHFDRLKTLFQGGEPERQVELPACEASLTLANQFVTVYYAVMRAQGITGRPFERSNDDPGPCLLDIFSGSLFTILYRSFETDTQIGDATELTARIIEDELIGMNEDSDNDKELECYENAVENYFKIMNFYISPLRKFDRRVVEKGLKAALEENSFC